MQLNGSEILIECLKEQGVDTVFGYPGGAILNVYDALYKHPEIRHVLTSHEQGASHAADGYARATGKVGVCLATSGPGATNLVTGIATAYMDSVPVVAVTCNVGVAALGKDSFQEIDILGITMPITKHNYIVKDVRDLADTIRNAFRIAKTGRPGPVLIDIPKDVTAAVTEYEAADPMPVYPVTRSIREEDIEAALKLIEECKKPFIMVGGGAVISGASDELAEFAALMDSPVCDTLMGKGAFDGESLNYTGPVGMHGTKASDFGVAKCDLLVAVGCRFSDRVTGNVKTFADSAKILQIDVDPAEVNKNVKVDVAVIGDIKKVLEILNSRMEQCEHFAWLSQVNRLKEQYPLTYNKDVLTGPYVIEKINELTKGEAIITTDVGQHQMWAAQFIKYKYPRTFLTSGGLGTMGYGLGAAIGAQVGVPEKQVINIAGDGCFRMNMNELATASRYNIPIVQVCINNHVLGMVRQWQTLFYGERYSHTVLDDAVDFVKVAEALGVKGIRVTKKEEVEPALKEALAYNGPVVIDCYIDQDEKVFPMVSPGGNIADAFSEEDLEEVLGKK
ncbi:MAG: biosynthetic-type acetolactate synthase large subunit [Lachnospiraceae bacterium]|nr:biosynthetic-type acetolactate synthase large subunit [Lachnospiraceae bacterium]